VEITTLMTFFSGVPRHHRGEIWKFLAEQYHLKHQFPNKQQPKDTPYKELLKQLTSQQHAILIDLGKYSWGGILISGRELNKRR